MEEFLHKRNLFLAKKERIAKGWSSEIFLVKDEKGIKYALKIEKEKSPRVDMVRKEAENLKLANSVGVGPKLFGFDLAKKIILMEFVEGVTFQEFLFGVLPKIKNKKTRAMVLHKFLDKLFAQARALDAAGLDHGQLAGKGKNILARKVKGKKGAKGKTPRYEPVIIDFEKASSKRKPHNLTQLEGFLLRNKYGAVAKKVKEISD